MSFLSSRLISSTSSTKPVNGIASSWRKHLTCSRAFSAFMSALKNISPKPKISATATNRSKSVWGNCNSTSGKIKRAMVKSRHYCWKTSLSGGGSGEVVSPLVALACYKTRLGIENEWNVPMIRELEVRSLRALRYVSVSLEPFLVMVGPNACGKSTLFDALLLVRDVLTSGLDAAVYGSSRMNIPPRAVDPRDLTWLREGGGVEIAITLELPGELVKRLDGRYRFARYEMGIRTEGALGFNHEALWLCNELKKPAEALAKGQIDLFPNQQEVPSHIVRPSNTKTPVGWRKVVSKTVESGNDYFRSETSDWNNLFRLGPSKSALANLPEDELKFPAATWTKRVLMEGVHRLMLNAEKMRLPAPAGSPSDFLPDGSNLPWIVQELEKSDNAGRKKSGFNIWHRHWKISRMLQPKRNQRIDPAIWSCVTRTA